MTKLIAMSVKERYNFDLEKEWKKELKNRANRMGPTYFELEQAYPIWRCAKLLERQLAFSDARVAQQTRNLKALMGGVVTEDE